MTEEVQEQSVESSQEPIQLTITDIATIKTVIDVASSRAAFKPEEMEAVGKIYNKISAFLTAVQEAIDKQKAAAEQGEEVANG